MQLCVFIIRLMRRRRSQILPQNTNRATRRDIIDSALLASLNCVVDSRGLLDSRDRWIYDEKYRFVAAVDTTQQAIFLPVSSISDRRIRPWFLLYLHADDWTMLGGRGIDDDDDHDDTN
jgi:hypothetical protein